MAKKKKIEMEAEEMIEESGPLFCFEEDDEDVGLDCRVDIDDNSRKDVVACAFNLPIDASALSDVLSRESAGEISVRDKQVIPCPKEGIIMVYLEYETNW